MKIKASILKEGGISSRTGLKWCSLERNEMSSHSWPIYWWIWKQRFSIEFCILESLFWSPVVSATCGEAAWDEDRHLTAVPGPGINPHRSQALWSYRILHHPEPPLLHLWNSNTFLLPPKVYHKDPLNHSCENTPQSVRSLPKHEVFSLMAIWQMQSLLLLTQLHLAIWTLLTNRVKVGTFASNFSFKIQLKRLFTNLAKWGRSRICVHPCPHWSFLPERLLWLPGPLADLSFHSSLLSKQNKPMSKLMSFSLCNNPNAVSRRLAYLDKMSFVQVQSATLESLSHLVRGHSPDATFGAKWCQVHLQSPRFPDHLWCWLRHSLNSFSLSHYFPKVSWKIISNDKIFSRAPRFFFLVTFNLSEAPCSASAHPLGLQTYAT